VKSSRRNARVAGTAIATDLTSGGPQNLPLALR
jgi:hypothetical protein